MQLARPSRLTKARVEMLDSVGFVWEASRRRVNGSDSSESESDADDDNAKSKRKKKKAKLSHLLRASKPSSLSNSNNMPVFAEPRRCRMGVDPPASHVAAMAQPGAQDPEPFAAVQAMIAAGQANMGLWAAAASGRGPFMPPAMNAGPPGINPAMFYQMQPWAAMMPGVISLAEMQKMQASMMQAAMANSQQAVAGRPGDPSGDSGTGVDSQEEQNPSNNEHGEVPPAQQPEF